MSGASAQSVGETKFVLKEISSPQRSPGRRQRQMTPRRNNGAGLHSRISMSPHEIRKSKSDFSFDPTPLDKGTIVYLTGGTEAIIVRMCSTGEYEIYVPTVESNFKASREEFTIHNPELGRALNPQNGRSSAPPGTPYKSSWRDGNPMSPMAMKACVGERVPAKQRDNSSPRTPPGFPPNFKKPHERSPRSAQSAPRARPFVQGSLYDSNMPNEILSPPVQGGDFRNWAGDQMAVPMQEDVFARDMRTMFGIEDHHMNSPSPVLHNTFNGPPHAYGGFNIPNKTPHMYGVNTGHDGRSNGIPQVHHSMDNIQNENPNHRAKATTGKRLHSNMNSPAVSEPPQPLHSKSNDASNNVRNRNRADLKRGNQSYRGPVNKNFGRLSYQGDTQSVPSKRFARPPGLERPCGSISRANEEPIMITSLRATGKSQTDFSRICRHFLSTEGCRRGNKCRFNHPEDPLTIDLMASGEGQKCIIAVTPDKEPKGQKITLNRLHKAKTAPSPEFRTRNRGIGMPKTA